MGSIHVCPIFNHNREVPVKKKCQLKWLTSALILLSATVFTTVASADTRTGKRNIAPPVAAGVAVDADNPVAMATLSLQLAKYGDKAKDPLAMVLAASLQKQSGAQSKEFKKTEEGKATGDAKPAIDDNVAGLLDRAKQYGNERSDIIALADDVANTAAKGRTDSSGAADNTYRGAASVRGNSTDIISVTFRAREIAAVSIVGDGDSDLDLYVYDKSGNEVCASVSFGDEQKCTWIPRWTEEYGVHIKNRGSISNRYGIIIH